MFRRPKKLTCYERLETALFLLTTMVAELGDAEDQADAERQEIDHRIRSLQSQSANLTNVSTRASHVKGRILALIGEEE